MGVRTGRGDKGFTDLSFRKDISKDSVEIRAIGDLDELVSLLGLIRTRTSLRKDKSVIERIQHTIYMIVSEIAVGVEKKEHLGELLREEESEWIKSLVYTLEEKVRPRSCFHLPGDNELSALFDVARTVARRAERSVVGLFQKDKITNENILAYLNCVSDVLFIMARDKAQKKTKKKAKKKKVSAKKRKRKGAGR